MFNNGVNFPSADKSSRVLCLGKHYLALTEVLNEPELDKGKFLVLRHPTESFAFKELQNLTIHVFAELKIRCSRDFVSLK